MIYANDNIHLGMEFRSYNGKGDIMNELIFVTGIALTIIGFIILFLRFHCDEMVALGIICFIGGIIIAFIGYFVGNIMDVI